MILYLYSLVEESDFYVDLTVDRTDDSLFIVWGGGVCSWPLFCNAVLCVLLGLQWS